MIAVPDRYGGDVVFSRAAHEVVDVVADIDDLASAGPVVALWSAIRDRDTAGGEVVLGAYTPSQLATSAVPLLVRLLQQAGHHHRCAHEEVLHQLVRPETDPFTPPRLDLGCPPGSHEIAPADPDLHECLCDVETACHALAPVVGDHAHVGPVHAQVLAHFTRDRHLRDLELVNVTLPAVAAFIEAAALLVSRRWRVAPATVFADAAAAVASAAGADVEAGRELPPRSRQ